MIPPEENARRMNAYSRGLTDTQMATQLGLSFSTVVYWRRQQDLDRNHAQGAPQPWTGAEKMLLRTLAHAVRKPELAERLGRSERSVEQMAHRLRIKIKRSRSRTDHTGPPPKETHRRRITDDEREKIMMLCGMVKVGRSMVPQATTAEVLNAAIEAIRAGYAKKFISVTEL